MSELTHYQEALLKKRRKDDADQRRRIDARAKQKLDQAKQKVKDEKEALGRDILMPDVFVSNNMKQKRNYKHYLRNKSRVDLAEKAHSRYSKSQEFTPASAQKLQEKVRPNALLLALRIKGKNSATTPQAQKILSELGLREVNNAVFLRADALTLKQLLLVGEYVTYGYPTKSNVDELVRKRGFLRKGLKKEPITNNTLIEELFKEFNATCDDPATTCICIEDIIDNINKAFHKDHKEVFGEIRKLMWPMQLASLKETMEDANVKHEAHGRDVRKKNTVVKKGGYIGFQGEAINHYVKALI
eukprot:CAMPEP_0170484686 /NCGR_PEP_ID=MMETSP0208-20121228/4092_1 /TAXON_ID=197538 /ORGANISM="Strombidium inclinatum, Strain S3" /LENGTH=300 /DNA_ID=CAMNT_0010758075 /DNA_START=26 /DNA_END=928 /DNA_ORIENTATION=+